jgi:Fe-S oxidoreductase
LKFWSCCLVRLHGRNHFRCSGDNRLCRRMALPRRDVRHLRRFGGLLRAHRSGPVTGAAEAANPEGSAARGQAHPHPPPAPAFRRHGVHGGGRRALALVDYAALCAMGRMRAPRGGDFVYVLDHAHEQLRGAGGEDPEGTWADRHHNPDLTRSCATRSISALSSMWPPRLSFSARRGAWRRCRW